MKTCKFFLQGTCRNGNRCRFSHDTLGNSDGNGDRKSGGFGSKSQSLFDKNGTTLSTTQGVTMTESGRTLAIEELQHPPIWPLSGFAVFKGLPSIVTGDVSCEEARWEAYQELKASGNCIQSTQKFQALAAEQQTQRQRVIWLLENRQSAQKLFNGKLLSEVEGLGVKSATANPFGGGTATSPFGGASSSFGGTARAANPFGGGAVAPVSSPFGNSASPAASLFGGSNSAAFGGTVASPFGGGSSTTTFRSPSIVGAGTGAGFAAANPFGGAAATSAPSPFGSLATPAFGGGAATPSSSPFGGGVSVTASPNGIGASVPSSAFSESGTGSGFTGVDDNAAKPAASPFVGGAATPAPSPFGGNTTASTSSPFGAPSVATSFGGISGATSRPNTFGDAASSINATAKPFGESSSGFGSSSGSTTGATNPFGASASSSTTTPSAFSAPSSSPFGDSTVLTSATSAAGRFGNSTSSNSSLFGGSSVLATAALPPPPVPAISGPPPEARDDAWNAEQFQQAEFSLGMVPTVPPPPQFC